ncbi:MAG TPA: DUF58 domain-containing protein [Thermosulfurimonas dismutans]|uniref:DUF58 domain-containing protein n=1 Tax=Thermosulfurimonas dismutans TaxID=999894 RepID=A0A7C3H3N1_9BACT|nr:DUF58 domain-containing protein [Thermosulfurimonas dismutans]
MKTRFRVRITTAGYLYIALTLAVALAGVNTGNNLLYLCASALLALMTLSGLLSVINLLGLSVRIEPPEEIFAEVPSPFGIHLQARGWPRFFLRVRLFEGESRVLYLRDRCRVLLWVRLPRRGEVLLPPLEIYSGYPLGLFRRSRFWPVGIRLLVYPRPLPGRVPFSVRETVPASSSGARFRQPEPEEFSGLGPYREGIPASRIAWRASARTGALRMKEFEGGGGRTLILDLGPAPSEEELSRATHLILRALGEGYAVGLRLGRREIPPGRGPQKRRQLLEALAHA